MLIALIITQFLLWQFIFGFQQVVLKISKQISSGVDLSVNDCQLVLTPRWMMSLGWINKFLSIALLVSVFLIHGFGWTIIFSFLIYAGGYAKVSFFFDSFIIKIGKHLIQQGLDSLKTAGHGYLTTFNIEEALSLETKVSKKQVYKDIITNTSKKTPKALEQAKMIEFTLESFGIKSRIVEVNFKKGFDLFHLEIPRGIRVEEIEKLSKTIALAVASKTGRVKVIAPIPGKGIIGIKVPK